MDEELQSQDTENLDNTGVSGEQATDDPAELLKQKEAEIAKYKAIAERKEKQLEKALSTLKGDEDKPKPRKTESNLTEIEEKLKDLEFREAHPDLKPHFDLIKTMAKAKGIDLDQAISDETVKKVLEAEAREKGVSIINSNNKIATPRSEQIKDKQKVIDVARSNPGSSEDALASYLQALKE